MEKRAIAFLGGTLLIFCSFASFVCCLIPYSEISALQSIRQLRLPLTGEFDNGLQEKTARSHKVSSQTHVFMGDESKYLDRIENLCNENGLFLDRSSDPSVVSTAATGLGILALAEGVTRNLRGREIVTKMARSAFELTVHSNLDRNRGWLSHFTDPNGEPQTFSEVSTIDTAIFYSGLLEASALLGDNDLRNEILQSLQRIDLQFVLRDGIFLHGFCWNDADGCAIQDTSTAPDQSGGLTPKFIPHKWNDSSEGVIIYRLFDLPFPMQIRRTDYPLFVYAYPLCFFDDPNYDEFLQEAIEGQIERYGYWGVTATDGPQGYVTFDRDIISPVLIGGIATKYDKYLEPLDSIRFEATAGSVHLPSGWTSSDDLTIDLSSAYILFSKWTRQSIERQNESNKLGELPAPKRLDGIQLGQATF